MKEINFKITEQDIKEYLKQHKDDDNIKYKEAMFVKYMKEQMLTKEALEIMMKKYNFEDSRIDGLYFYDDYDVMRSISYKTFDTYLDGIKNLDISGICHILIPCVQYYGYNNFVYLNYLKEVSSITKLLDINSSFDGEQNSLVEAMDNYMIAGYSNDYYTIKISKEKSRKMIQEYSYIYGEEPVKVIRKSIRERV